MNIIISGGSKGLGKDLISKFLNRGSNVINLSRTQNNTNNKNLFNYKVDLTFEKNTLKTIKKVKKKHDNIDLIICCVGSGKSVEPGRENKNSWEDRKSVVYGKSVDLGGRRIIKKKKRNKKSTL